MDTPVDSTILMGAAAPAPSEIPPKLVDLFRRTEAALKNTSLGPGNRWHIIILACMVAGPDPEAIAHLYRYLCSTPEYATPSDRQALVRRLREALVKSISIVGVCKPIEAVLAISKIERPEDKDFSMTRDTWQCDEANLQRAEDWYGKIYQRNGTGTMDLFAAHRDFAWLSKHITYGLYLGDRQVLDDLDTEMVVFPSIMSQNLKTETWWHIRGTRRIGVSKEDTETLWRTIKDINAHFGVSLDKVPTVDEVEHDV